MLGIPDALQWQYLFFSNYRGLVIMRTLGIKEEPSGSKENMANSLCDINTVYHAADYKTTQASS